jgi:TIR domain
VFLCWSGTRSRHFAAIVRDWLPKVLGPSLQPAVSTQIEKGSAWFDELRNALDNSDCGILCLTAEAIGSPWVHFEAGLLVRALSKSSNPGMAETKHRRVFPLLYDITGEVLKGPLSVYQSTSARDLDDVLRLIEAIYQIMPEKERMEFTEVTKRLRKHWDSFQTPLSNIPRIELEEIVPEFEGLFRRKTFQESMYDCLSQDWLGRYNGARDVLNKLKGYDQNVLRACRVFVSDVYAALMVSLDSYVMCLSKLLGTGESPIHAETGQLRFDNPGNNPGIATACEKHRKRILRLVEWLSDEKQAPFFDEAFRFEEATFERKKSLIHDGKAFADKEIAHGKKFGQKLELCADSLWDFDRILYFQCHEEGNKLALKEEVSRARRELEKANAKGGGASLMALNYSLRPVEKALSASLTEAESADVKLLCDDIREFIKRTDTDKGGHVRAKLERIEAFRV